MSKRYFMLIATKVAIFGLLWWAIYQQLFSSTGSLWDLLSYDWRRLNNNGYWWVAVGLVGINWSLEAIKWRALLLPIAPQSFREALRGVLGGIALALFTPNRIGEYGGRIWWLPEPVRWQGVMALLLGNMLQLSVNLTLGAMGFSAYCYWFRPFGAWVWATVAGFGAAVGVPLLFYMVFSARQRQRMMAWVGSDTAPLQCLGQYGARGEGLDRSTSWWHHFWQYIRQTLGRLRHAFIQTDQTYTPIMVRQVWVWSVLRYAVYVGQYVLLLLALGVKDPIASLVVAVLSAYFVQTVLPTVAVLELGIKGNIALYFFAALTADNAAILMATLLLWCLNLALPAMLGAICFWTSKDN